MVKNRKRRAAEEVVSKVKDAKDAVEGASKALKNMVKKDDK